MSSACCELLSESYLCIIFYNQTTTLPTIVRLWIAFRIVSLHYLLQQDSSTKHFSLSCELLSESYLCIIFYNSIPGVSVLWAVVNCFQNRIFALSFTTESVTLIAPAGLWIAFRIVSLHYLLQPSQRHCFFRVVVNCFQNRIFALSFTTEVSDTFDVLLLWIAFRIVSLHYLLQHLEALYPEAFRCELLSESYLCIIFYNISIE